MVAKRYDVEVFTEGAGPNPKIAVGQKKDRSLAMCLVSMLLFLFICIIIILSIILYDKKSEENQETSHLNGSDTGTTAAQVGNRIDTGVTASVNDHPNVRKHQKTTHKETPIIVLGGDNVDEEDYSDGSDTSERQGRILNNKPNTQNCQTPFKLCESPACRMHTGLSTTMMDLTVDPCQDFYSYACGGLQNSLFLQEPDMSLNYFERVRDKTKQVTPLQERPADIFWKYIESCESFPLYKLRTNYLRELLKSVGGFYSSQDWKPEYFNITDTLATMMLIDVAPMFEVGVQLATENKRATYIFILRAPSQSLLWSAEQMEECGTTTPLEADEACKNFREKETELAKEALSILTNHNQHEISEIMDELEAFYPIKALSNEKSDDNEFVVFTVGDLNRNFPAISWIDILYQLSGKQVGTETTVYVYNHNELEMAFAQASLLPRITHNRMMLSLAIKLFQQFLLPSYQQPQTYCTSLASYLLKDISSLIYLRTYSDAQEKITDFVKATFNETLTSMIRQIDKSFCLEDKTREILKDKLSRLSLVQEAEVARKITIEKLQSAFTNFVPENDFVSDTLMWARRGKQLIYGLWGKDARRTDLWWINPSTSSLEGITFLPEVNVVFVPIKYLEVGNLMNLPKFIVQSTLGYDLGKAIASALTFSVANLDESENNAINRNNLLSFYSFNKTIQTSFGEITFKEPTEQDQNIRIHDDLGLRAAFAAGFNEPEKVTMMDAQRTPQSEFFINAAQVMCTKKSGLQQFDDFVRKKSSLPSLMRIALSFPNFSEFSMAFHCSRFDGDEVPVLCNGGD